jgi:hypothetical protein
MSYNDALSYIFETYMQKKDLLKGKRYQEYKNVNIIKDLIIELKLQPEINKVIKVTGSKGKGTTTRTIAALIQNETNKHVAAFTSPEELEHTDRISINSRSISKTDFTRILDGLKAQLDSKKKEFKTLDYFSPYGIFLLIALTWFKEQNVDFYIIECGRGVRYDDSNSINGKLGVITSIFEEHLDYFGPTEMDVFRDKIAISDTSEKVIVSKKLQHFMLPSNTSITNNNHLFTIDVPKVYKDSLNLATEASREILSREVKIEKSIFQSSSYGSFAFNGNKVIYDALIDVSGIDKDWAHNHQDFFYFVSIPDDKDFDNILECIQSLNIKFQLVALSQTNGYLSYNKTQSSGHNMIELSHKDGPKNLDFYLKHSNSNKIIFWGTQSFIRFVKGGFPLGTMLPDTKMT